MEPPQQLGKKGWSIVEEVTSYIYAVGRIPGKGSCILISKPDSNKGILLTTSYVLKHRHDAADLQAVFFETKTLGTGLQNVPDSPVAVPLRPAKFFFSSAQPHEDVRTDESSLGYSVVACDTVGTQIKRRMTPMGVEPEAVPGTIASILPLALPLIVSKIPHVELGDEHLLVTHVNGNNNRRYYVCTVVEVQENYCVYQQVDPTAHFASGGPVFSQGGEFIGIQHQSGDFNFCIYLRDIVVHLFESAMLGGCGVKVVDSQPERVGDSDPCHSSNSPLHRLKVEQDLLKTGGALGDLPDEESVGEAGDFVVPYEVYQRRQHRAAKGPTQQTLLVRKHLEIWEEWYKPGDYRTLVLLLHAFPHHSKLLAMALKELTSHDQRGNIHRIAELGGIGVLVEAMDNMPFDETVMTAGMTALGRISLYDQNREALSRCDGTTVVTRLLAEYLHSSSVVQWATYCLLNLCHSNHAASENIATLVKCDGLGAVDRAMNTWPDVESLQKWGSSLFGYVVAEGKTYFDMAIDLRLCGSTVDRLHDFRLKDSVMAALVFLVEKLTNQESYIAATNFFLRSGILGIFADILQLQAKTKGPEGRTICTTIASCIKNILDRIPAAAVQAVETNLEELMIATTTEWLSDPPLHIAVAGALMTMGVEDPGYRYSHLQLGPSSATVE